MGQVLMKGKCVYLFSSWMQIKFRVIENARSRPCLVSHSSSMFMYILTIALPNVITKLTNNLHG